MPIPLRTALIGSESGHEICPERLIVLDQWHEERDAMGVSLAVMGPTPVAEP